MLTFEVNVKDEKLEMHADRPGLLKLVAILQKLADAEAPDNVHLMTADWGGDELSSVAQTHESLLINHLKIMLWT